jgi:hypothetical protein
VHGPVLRLRCARGGGRAPPRTTRAAFRTGVPAFSGSRGLGRGTRKAQTERRSSAGALLNIPPPPPLRPLLHRRRSCPRGSAARRRAPRARGARRATSSSPSPSVRQGWGAGTATHDAGGLPHGNSYFLGQPWLRPRDPKDAGGGARQRRCPVKYKPPPLCCPRRFLRTEDSRKSIVQTWDQLIIDPIEGHHCAQRAAIG